MFKYVSKWYQDILKTPRPDVEEATEELRVSLDYLNKAIAHLQDIEGISIVLQANDYSNHRFYISSAKHSKFKLTLNHVSESHNRSF